MNLDVTLTKINDMSTVTKTLLTISLSSAPLRRRLVTSSRSGIFGRNSPVSTKNGLHLPQLAHPMGVLILKIGILASSISRIPRRLRKLQCRTLIGSFSKLSSTVLLLQFGPRANRLIILSLPESAHACIHKQLAGLGRTGHSNNPTLTTRSIDSLLNKMTVSHCIHVGIRKIRGLVSTLNKIAIAIPRSVHCRSSDRRLCVGLGTNRRALSNGGTLRFLHFHCSTGNSVNQVRQRRVFVHTLTRRAVGPTAVTHLPGVLSIVRRGMSAGLSVRRLLTLANCTSRIGHSGIRVLVLPNGFDHPRSCSLDC